eukprot:TRINITY_DN19_c0_g1_i2.p1 TRINITY_DN19_c0_g1~~TRINITY_DN19_c0_g1_i2.p1  ORF type:complete len:103 (-),score=28.66 TRINITY_DN19_c0_g1_i2:70-378(-)
MKKKGAIIMGFGIIVAANTLYYRANFNLFSRINQVIDQNVERISYEDLGTGKWLWLLVIYGSVGAVLSLIGFLYIIVCFFTYQIPLIHKEMITLLKADNTQL